MIVFPNSDFTSNAERTILRLEALRLQAFATSATIIFAPENNLYHYTQALNDLLMRKTMFDRNLIDKEGKAITPQPIRLCNYITYRMNVETLGVLTQKEGKITGTNKLHSLVINQRLFVWERMTPAAMGEWKTTIDQMSNWCMTPNINGTYVFGANGMKTDHIMALIVGVYAIFQWTEGKAEEISRKFESTSCLCNCANGLCGRRVLTPFVHRV